MSFRESVRNIAMTSGVLLAIVTFRAEEGIFQFLFAALSLILVVVGGLYCLPTPQFELPKEKGIRISKADEFLVDPKGNTEKSIVSRHYRDGELKGVRILKKK